MNYSQIYRGFNFQASAYAKCVAVKENVTKDVCVKEFRALKECFTIAVSFEYIISIFTDLVQQ